MKKEQVIQEQIEVISNEFEKLAGIFFLYDVSGEEMKLYINEIIQESLQKMSKQARMKH